MFDFNSFPFQLSGKTVDYICPKWKYNFDAPIEAVLEFEQEDEWNGLPISTPPNALAHATGMVEQKDMMRVGIIMGIIGLTLGYIMLVFCGKAGLL